MNKLSKIINPEAIAEGSITVDKLNTNVVESLKTDSNFVTVSDLKTINGTSILGSGDITISGGSSDANVQAVDTGDVIDDVNVDYATITYVDGLVGDINSVLESIISGGDSVSLITFTIGSTEYQAEEGMTWVDWVNSEYNTRQFVIQGSYVSLNGATVTSSGGSLIQNTSIIESNGEYNFMD